MDTLTHGLSGALAARLLPTTTPRTSSELRQVSWLGFLAAAAPDLDFVIALVATEPMTYLNHHRGVTHSILLLPLWAALLTGIFKLCFRALDSHLLYGVCCLSLGIHILGDVITSYGTMIFAPFSNYRAALDTTFIIDPIFSGIILCGLLVSWWRPRRSLIPRLAGCMLLGYIGLQAWAHQQAITLGKTYAQKQQLVAQIHALPQPLSPLHWQVMVIEPNQYHMAYVRLWGQPVKPTSGSFLNRLASIYQSPDILDWRSVTRPNANPGTPAAVSDAWENPALDDFRRFARYPVHTPGLAGDCQWFHDLQFQLPGRQNPFIYGLCRRPGQQNLRLARYR